MKLIVGLGNPGKEYENTKHNVGFMAIDYFANQNNLKVKKRKFSGVFYKGKNLIVAKPLTYMNNSGNFVYAITKFYKVNVANVLVIYDDWNLQVGQLKMKPQGSDGGQKGIQDVILQLGTEKIWRIKVGIGKPPKENGKDYVLSGFTKEEKNKINFRRISEGIDLFIHDQKEHANNLINGK